MPELPIYLDHHATTPTDPRVVETMLPYFSTRFGNPASQGHKHGWVAEEAVDEARRQVARLIGARPSEIVFTSGATESNNLVIKGLAAGRASGHLVTSALEHASVLAPMRRLAREGWELSLARHDRDGLVTADSVDEVISPRTVLVSISAANHEVGTRNPIGEIARRCRERGVLFHTDATQAVGKVAIDVGDGPIDFLSFSGHKLYGPKGIGVLYVRSGTPRLVPLFDGGGQERGLRSGTLAVPLIAGLGEAARLALEERETEAERVGRLRDLLQRRVVEALEGVGVNGHSSLRLPANLSVSFEGVEGEALLAGLRTIAVSSGSACTTQEKAASQVLTGLGLSEDLARATLRFGLGRWTTEEEVELAANAVIAVVDRLRRRGQSESSMPSALDVAAGVSRIQDREP